jgi:hypothetical protein
MGTNWVDPLTCKSKANGSCGLVSKFKIGFIITYKYIYG